MQKNLYFTIFLVLALFLNTSQACTRLLNAQNPNAVILGRTMDWSDDLYTNLFVFPRGIMRHGQAMVNPLTWSSKYGSIAATAYDQITTDGLNEKGLAAHVLWLKESDYGQRDAKRQGLSITMWAQYFLDNFASVQEAIQATNSQNFQIEPFVDPATKRAIKLHLALEDKTGDSAIIEYINGQVYIYHSRQYTVLTNSPNYKKQLENVTLYTGFGGDKPIPGAMGSRARFVRGSYYLKYLPNVDTKEASITQTLSALRTITEPYHDVHQSGKDFNPTLWHTLIDLTDQTYYFNNSTQLNYVWTNLNNFDLSQHAEILKLDMVQHPEYTGDVTKLFKPVKSVKKVA